MVHHIRKYYLRAFWKLSSVMIILALMGLDGCYNEEEDCNRRPIWKSCYSTEPTDGKLSVEVTINNENQQVVINIYEDDIEDNLLIFTDTVSSEDVDYHLPVGTYSGSAKYIVGGDTVLAIDGDKIDTEFEEYCYEDCWDVKDAKLNLTLDQ